MFDDADLAAAADAAVFGAHFVSGQCCVATERLLVHNSIHDELVALVMERAEGITLGDPLEDTTLMGPLNNETIAARMDTHVADAQAGVPKCCWAAAVKPTGRPACSTNSR